jgi:hypothetical protein
VAGHLLALEHAARVLTLTGRAVRAVRDRHAVRGAQTAEVVPLHGTGEALADRGAGDVHVLTFEVVVGDDFLTDVQQVLGIDAELGKLALGLHAGLGEVTAHRRGDPLGLGRTGAELHGGVAVFLGGPLGHHLQVVELKDGHGDLLPVLHEEPGHAQLLGDYTRAQHV